VNGPWGLCHRPAVAKPPATPRPQRRRPGRPPAEEGPAASRASLLAIAARQLAIHGFARTTFRGIAAEAGVSYGSVQHHFPTKARLWSALVEEVLVPAHRASPPVSNAQDIRRVLTGMVRARVEAAVLRPGLSAAILTDSSEGAEARLDELASALQAHRATEREVLRTLIAAGQLRAVDEQAVMAVLGVALATLSSAKPAMAALLGLDMDDADTRERLARGIADLLLHGLLPR
jgi:AcrR family transcriptional regulator